MPEEIKTPDSVTAAGLSVSAGSVSETPRTDAMCVDYSGPLSFVGDEQFLPADFARTLERDLKAERKRRVLAEATVTACHSAMLGKVNPKHPAWGCVFAVQDAARKADSQNISISDTLAGRPLRSF